MTDAPAPRKPKALGPVHIYPEPPKKLAAGSPVAAVVDGAFGKVKTVNPGDRYVVEWEDGFTTSETRPALLSRFTSSTPAPRNRKKAAA